MRRRLLIGPAFLIDLANDLPSDLPGDLPSDLRGMEKESLG